MSDHTAADYLLTVLAAIREAVEHIERGDVDHAREVLVLAHTRALLGSVSAADMEWATGISSDSRHALWREPRERL